MNQHLDPVRRHAYPACARSDLYCSCLRLSTRFDNVPKLIRRHKYVTQVLSTHPKLRPSAHHKRLRHIQRPSSAAPDEAASFKPLYLNRPRRAAPLPVSNQGDPDTALRHLRTSHQELICNGTFSGGRSDEWCNRLARQQPRRTQLRPSRKPAATGYCLDRR